MNPKIICLFMTLTILLWTSLAFAVPTSGICINKNNALVIRQGKCNAGERKATIATLAEGIKSNADFSGPQGPAGAAGAAGAAGVSGREIVTAPSPAETYNLAAGETKTVLAACPLPKVMFGGACNSSNSKVITYSSTVVDGFGSIYACEFRNTDLTLLTGLNLKAIGVCGSVQ